MSTRLYSKLIFILFFSALGFKTVFAQDNEIEEIQVIGEKLGRDLLNTASSVGIVTAEDIEARSLESVQDILSQLANVSALRSGGGFSIRGVNNSGVTGVGGGPVASIYVDGAISSEFAPASDEIDTWDLERVEVYRGAQSTNQGRNSLAGAVIVRSKDPSYEREITGRFRASRFDSYVGSAALNLPLVDDQLAVRFSFDYKDSDGFIENTTLSEDDFGRSERISVRGKILYEPDAIPALRNILTVSFSSTENGASFVDDAPDPFDRVSTANLPAEFETDQTIVTWEAQYELQGPWSLENVLSYNQVDHTSTRDDDRLAGGGINRRTRDNDTDTISEEFRIHYNGERLRGYAGAYYFDETIDNTRETFTGISVPAALPGALAPFGPLIAPFYADPFLLNAVDTNDDSTTNYAFFFNADFDVSSLITINAGLRYDHEKKDFNGTRVGSLGSALPDVTTVPAALQALVGGINGLLQGAVTTTPEVINDKYDAWLPQAGVVFNWTETFTTTFQAKRSYRAGGAFVTILQGQLPFDPEFAWTYEGGFRAKLFDNRALLSANVFYTDWKDMQVLENNGGLLSISNAGESEVKGFEIEFNATPNEHWDIFANAGYTDTEFTEFISSTGQDLSGNEFLGAPDWTAAAGLTWRMGNGLFIQSDINYQSKLFDDVANTERLDSRVLWNGKVGYESEKYSIFVFARNLFDENYRTNLTTNTVGTISRIGEPRVFGIEVRLKM